MFLAFAYLYPDFQLLLFFILPVKVKWLALLQWIGYFYVMLVGDCDDAIAGGGRRCAISCCSSGTTSVCG